MDNQSKLKWNPELGEWIEKRDKVSFSFCPNCGESNRNPERVGRLFICKECKRIRLEDCMKLDKVLKQWFNIK